MSDGELIPGMAKQGDNVAGSVPLSVHRSVRPSAISLLIHLTYDLDLFI